MYYAVVSNPITYDWELLTIPQNVGDGLMSTNGSHVFNYPDNNELTVWLTSLNITSDKTKALKALNTLEPFKPYIRHLGYKEDFNTLYIIEINQRAVNFEYDNYVNLVVQGKVLPAASLNDYTFIKPTTFQELDIGEHFISQDPFTNTHLVKTSDTEATQFIDEQEIIDTTGEKQDYIKRLQYVIKHPECFRVYPLP